MALAQLWSPAAAVRAARAAILIPALFAVTYEVIANEQIALFAAFGGFATLVLPTFGGGRWDKALAHLGLAIAGTGLIAVGTAVSSSLPLLAVVTLLVAFLVLFAGIAGPNAANGANAAMLTYVLAVAIAADPGTIPLRLAGWWLASLCGGIAVVAASGARPATRLRAAISASAGRLADELQGAGSEHPNPTQRESSKAAADELSAAYTAAPYRATGLAIADQAAGNLVEGLQWSSSLVADAFAEGSGIDRWRAADLALLQKTATVLRAVAALARGEAARPDLGGLERVRLAANTAAPLVPGDISAHRAQAHRSWHASTIALAIRTVGADALIASRRADPQIIAQERRVWFGGERSLGSPERWPLLRRAAVGARRHASLRSVWTVNSLRGAVAIAAAVTVADVTGVQHGFWVVLGTFAVLRSNALATGATALRALAGTVAGFVIGAGLILAISTHVVVLWSILPLAVLLAAYTPGVLPFAAGQAAFTVLISILYNILVPVGWIVGVLRVEDVALGCAVSLFVGVLFWPRGAGGVVASDLRDAFSHGATYLRQGASWAVGTRGSPPAAGPASVDAALRLEDALRGYLTEQGSKRVAKEDVWRLVGAVTRLRLTAQALSELRAPVGRPGLVATRLRARADAIASWYQDLADHLGEREPAKLEPLGASVLTTLGDEELAASDLPRSHSLLAVEQHLRHLVLDQETILKAAIRMSSQQRRAWWH